MSAKVKTAILAFVPVIHKGYVEFFSKQQGDIYILGKDIIGEYVHLTRDLRLIDPLEAVKALKSIIPRLSIHVATVEDLKGGWNYELTIMPEDEVSLDLSKRYLKGKKVKFEPVFLRWNKIITFKEHRIQADRKISKKRFDRMIMAKVCGESEKSSDWWRQNGAVAFKNGKVILATHNSHLPTDFHLSVNGDPRSNFDAGQHQDIYTSIHAEAKIVAMAAEKGQSLKGTSFYMTTFPCPNCARLIGTAGIKKLFYSKGYSLLDAEKILRFFGMEIILVQ